MCTQHYYTDIVVLFAHVLYEREDNFDLLEFVFDYFLQGLGAFDAGKPVDLVQLQSFRFC